MLDGEEGRARLGTALLCAIAVWAALALAALWAYGQAHPPHRACAVPEALALLVPDDAPLMSARQRAWARQSGVAAYEWDGMWFVDASLPEEYWR